MLFYLKYLEHDVGKLQKLIEHFFAAIKNGNPAKFEVSLLPDWYLETPNRLQKLEVQLERFLSFPREVKESIIEAFIRSNQIETLFTNKSEEYAKIPVGLDFIISVGDGTSDHSVEHFLNELFVENLYKNQLGKKDSTFSIKVGKNLGDHYSELCDMHRFSNEDFALCPFCGIEALEMIESEGRPDYDHLLPKGNSMFVFAAVNLKNLVPIGHKCNTLKLSKHLLYSDGNRENRTIAFYPFENSANPVSHPFELFKFSLICDELPSNLNQRKGKWRVEIEPNSSSDEQLVEKINTWDRVYNIKNRYANFVKDRYKIFLTNIIQQINSVGTNPLQELKKELQELLEKRYLYQYNFISVEEGLIPRRIFFEWALNNDEYLLTHIQAVELDRNINSNDHDMYEY